MAKNHYWKQFERACSRDFGGVGRFPANQGGELDFETPYAIGQCKTTGADKRSYTVHSIAELTQKIHHLGRRDSLRREKWPMVCVKVRRGAGVKSEALYCVAMVAAEEWIGSPRSLYAEYMVKERGPSLDALTDAVETLLREEPETIGVRVMGCKTQFVAMARARFLQSYTFKKAEAVS